MKISFFFAWYDFWVGFFYDRRNKVLYLCPLPCCVFKIERERVGFSPINADLADTLERIRLMEDLTARSFGVPPEYLDKK